MILTLFCNRCGKKELGEYYAITEHIKGVKKRFLIFCPDCGQSFVNWFKEKPEHDLKDQSEVYKKI